MNSLDGAKDLVIIVNSYFTELNSELGKEAERYK